MTRRVIWTKQFKKDYKAASKRGANIQKLDETIIMLANGTPLAQARRNHALSGNYLGFRECHIEPDWLLIYAIDGNDLILTLVRTGSHSDLFKK